MLNYLVHLLDEMDRKERLRQYEASRELEGTVSFKNRDHLLVASSDGRGSAAGAMAKSNNCVAESPCSSTIATASSTAQLKVESSECANKNPLPAQQMAQFNIMPLMIKGHSIIAEPNRISNPDRAFDNNARARIRAANNGEEASHF